jgi:hypothetical protein
VWRSQQATDVIYARKAQIEDVIDRHQDISALIHGISLVEELKQFSHASESVVDGICHDGLIPQHVIGRRNIDGRQMGWMDGIIKYKIDKKILCVK